MNKETLYNWIVGLLRMGNSYDIITIGELVDDAIDNDIGTLKSTFEKGDEVFEFEMSLKKIEVIKEDIDNGN